jgi:hypothetical protein
MRTAIVKVLALLAERDDLGRQGLELSANRVESAVEPALCAWRSCWRQPPMLARHVSRLRRYRSRYTYWVDGRRHSEATGRACTRERNQKGVDAQGVPSCPRPRQTANTVSLPQLPSKQSEDCIGHQMQCLRHRILYHFNSLPSSSSFQLCLRPTRAHHQPDDTQRRRPLPHHLPIHCHRRLCMLHLRARVPRHGFSHRESGSV